jgi:carbamoyl-phosphate synthase large subunit
VADVRPHDEVDAEALAVTRALGIVGPCNVQLRSTARGPVTFEINPRCSGGASIRAHFGFNEVEMPVTELVRRLPVPRPELTMGTAKRFWAEQYVDDEVGLS